MATLKVSQVVAALVCLVLFGCGKKLVGLDTPVTPLAQIRVEVTDDLGVVQLPDPNLRVALVWGAQWMPEPFCVLPAEPAPATGLLPSESTAADVIAAGCPDSYRFVPNVAGPDIAIQPGVPATIDFITLPRAGVMVGDITARVAYASLIVYDDRNGNGTLDFHHPPRRRHHNDPPDVEDAGAAATWDVVYGASFVSMTEPDDRIAYMEGDNSNINTIGFYPRNGCDPPPPGFSILSAGGFPLPDLSDRTILLAMLRGQMPEEDPSTCAATPVNQVGSIAVDAAIPVSPVVTIALDPAQRPKLAHFACTANDSGGSTLYRQPPDAEPDWAHSTWACLGLPQILGDDAGVAGLQQLVIAGASTDACPSVNHYILRGCDTDPNCAVPAWPEVPGPPPAWWPCQITP